jgi:hypothetical protein
MKKFAAAVAAAVAVLAMAALSGVALAGDHHGDHGSHHNKGQTSGSAPQKSSPDTQAGIKPSNTTDKKTSCTTGGGSGTSATCHSDKSDKSDASKRYGNGKTAAQIANGKGAPSGTPITGPGNSQPHKICGRDVHAYKGGDCSKKQHEEKPAKSQEQQQTVTFCDMESATSGKLETKNADEVARHEFNGNPEENRDIVPPFTLNGQTFSENWDANGQAIFNAGCGGSSGEKGTQSSQQTVTFCDMDTATTGKLETRNAAEVAHHEFNGSPEENRDIVPPFTLNGQTLSENWDANGQAIFNAGCGGSSGEKGTQSSQQTVTFCDMDTATTGKLETKNAAEVAHHEFNGSPEENRDIVPPFTLNGQTFSENWDANGQAIFNSGCGASSGVKAAVKSEEQKPQGKVYICHATGSATNPYVLIHVSVNALPAHTRHQDGRDIVLGDQPGPCPTAAAQQQQQPQQNAAAAAAPATPSSAATAAAPTATAAPAAAATPVTPSTASGVKGASKTIAAPAAASTKPSSGVLGTAKTLGSAATTGTLPFTGLRLWIVELVALGLIGGGVAMRLIARRRMN